MTEEKKKFDIEKFKADLEKVLKAHGVRWIICDKTMDGESVAYGYDVNAVGMFSFHSISSGSTAPELQGLGWLDKISGIEEYRR